MVNNFNYKIYGITPETEDTEQLFDLVKSIIKSGVWLIQYRNKTSSYQTRLEQVSKLLNATADHRYKLIVNDSIDLAKESGAHGVHLGKFDNTIEIARKTLGNEAIVGSSCYNELERAEKAQKEGADYVAFGSFFPSETKPTAVKVDIDLLSIAKKKLSVPIVAIGGITLRNGHSLVKAGADCLAISQGLFGANNPSVEAKNFLSVFN